MPLVRRLGWPGEADAEPRPRHIGDLALGDQGTIVVERYRGGAGDLICARPAIRALRDRYPGYRMILHFPAEYRELLEDLGDDFYDYSVPENSFLYCEACELRGHIEHLVYYHLFCPCGVHEHETDGRPTECRIDNFARLVEAQGQRPDLSYLVTPSFEWETDLPVVGIQLRTATRAKEWPTEYWAAVFDAFRDRCRFVAFDNQDTTAKRLEDAGIDWGPRHERFLDPLVTVCDSQPWRVTVTMADACKALLVPDSAMLHVAGALGKPFVGLFGATNGQLTLTYYPTGRTLQGIPDERKRRCEPPCYYYASNRYHCAGVTGDCMANISPESVIAELEAML